MVFSTTNLFKGIQCPQGEECVLTSCIFAHDLRPQKSETSEELSNSASQSRNYKCSEEPAAKRRRVTYERASDKPPSTADKIRSDLAATRESSITDKQTSTAGRPSDANGPSSLHSLPSLAKPVSPPPTNGKASSHSSQAGTNNSRADNNNINNNSNVPTSQANGLKIESHPEEKLNPRLIANDPAGHAKRSLYLKYLHGEMARLNQKVSKSQNMEYKQFLFLTEQELVKLALDEEEKVAKDQPMLYANIVKQRIAFYKKMQLEDWVKHVKTSFEKDKPKPANRDAKPVETGLNPEEELLILPHLVTDQTGLEKYGYVPTPPTVEQAAEAAAAVEASKNYEVCDRCSARFQVFPERNAEGLLTSNGPCKHHPNKKMFPQKTKGDVVSGLPKEPYYPCCNRAVGSPGCTENEYHVFKSSMPARLAAVLPFITTPENGEPARDKHGWKVKAVTFDCEMGYTVFGLELIRLTAVIWPSGEELLDVLVRPVGTIIDLNSRFSGVWPEDITNAVPYDEWITNRTSLEAANGTPTPPSSPPLPIVSSPAEARTLLTTFLTPQTPLIGHAIDNDLNAVRLCHPTIIDTVILFPHPKGLPMRFGLKMLSSRHLNRSIQTGGDRGHDSLEDAQATGELVRFKIGEKWKLLKATGWGIVEGRLVVPPPLRREMGDAGSGFVDGEEDHVKAMVAKALDGRAAGKKRRKKRTGDGAEESTEDEEVPLGNGLATYVERAKAMENEGGSKGT